MPAPSHDSLFKAAFGQPDLARDELALLLPEAIRSRLDLSTLKVVPGSFVDEELRNSHTDLLYAIRTGRGTETLVHVVFEHQSSFDATMPFRMLRYVVRIWERWLGEHVGTVRLPIVLPMVVHHSEGGWRAAPELATSLDGDADLLEATRPYVPHFRFLLDDLSGLSVEQLAQRTAHALVRMVLMALWSSRSRARLDQAVPLLAAVASGIERDERARQLLVQLYVYLWQAAPQDVAAEEMRAILIQVAGPQGAEDVVNAAEQLIARGREEGLQGLRQALGRILAARGVALSDLGRARVASSADVAQLTTWLERAAAATSEAEVFGPASGT